MLTEARSCMRSAHAFASPLPAAWCSAVSPWVLAHTTQTIQRTGDGIFEGIDATGCAGSSDWWMGRADGGGTRGLLIQAIDLFATIDEQLRVKNSGHPERIIGRTCASARGVP